MKSPAEIDKIIKQKGADQIVSRECKHATYTVSEDGSSDALVVKEWITFKDGDRLPTLKTYRDYKRPYWITKEGYRDHDEKIQFEDMSRVNQYKCRQIDLPREIYQHLRFGSPDWNVRRLARKPFVYGCDFGPEVYLKQKYMDKWPGVFQPNNVTVFDAETNVLENIDQRNPILWSEVTQDEVILYYDKKWTREHPNYEDAVFNEYRLTLPKYLDQIREKLRNKKTGESPKWIDDIEKMPLRFVRGDDHVDMTKQMINHFHYTQPDILTGWNVFFDATIMSNTLMNAGILPQRVLSDPRVDLEYQMAYLKKGQKRKVMAGDRDMPLGPHEQWDIMLHTAAWRLSDSMQTYWQLRKAKGKESGGYGLDVTLTRQIGVGKVKVSTDKVDVPSNTLHWHMEMQKHWKVEYGVYNIFDSVGLKCQELKNNDLSSQISALSGSTDYSRFNSQPTINAADMHFFAIKERKKVLCTTSDEMETELDDLLLSRDGWINLVA